MVEEIDSIRRQRLMKYKEFLHLITTFTIRFSKKVTRLRLLTTKSRAALEHYDLVANGTRAPSVSLLREANRALQFYLDS
jgi:hypothetical protein